MSLYYCSNCKENSVVIKKKKISENVYSRVEFCINDGCGYKLKLPDMIIISKEVMLDARTV